jgi:hypothetical protein
MQQEIVYVDDGAETLDRLLVFCAGCSHSEFIHSDRGARPCLYSECACASFVLTLEPDLADHRRRRSLARIRPTSDGTERAMDRR